MNKKQTMLKFSVAAAWVRRQRKAGTAPHALFTDIDDTFLHRGGDQKALRAAHTVRDRTRQTETPLVFVTGLRGDEVLQRIDARKLPAPEIIVGSVGTEILLRLSNNAWQPDDAYGEFLQAKNYDAGVVRRAVERFRAQAEFVLYDLQFNQNGFGPYKISLHFLGDDAVAQYVRTEAQTAFPDYKIVVCKEIHYNASLPPGDVRLKYCLDIVPATKADAIAYLIDALGIKAGFKAGDSGNDTEMLLQPDPLLPILVGGYKSEALDAIAPYVIGDGDDSFFTLRDGRPIFIETGDRLAAQSIVYAMDHYNSK